jgi:hypothetical protein
MYADGTETDKYRGDNGGYDKKIKHSVKKIRP